MNTNIFGLNKKSKYKYEYIWVDKKGQMQKLIQIFGLVGANTYMNTNICHTLLLAKNSFVNGFPMHNKFLFILASMSQKEGVVRLSS